ARGAGQRFVGLPHRRTAGRRLPLRRRRRRRRGGLAGQRTARQAGAARHARDAARRRSADDRSSPGRGAPMSRSAAFAVAVAVATACAPRLASSQQTERERRAADPATASLEGTLVSARRVPLADIAIVLRTVEGRRIGETRSDGEGRFTFTNLRSG